MNEITQAESMVKSYVLNPCPVRAIQWLGNNEDDIKAFLDPDGSCYTLNRCMFVTVEKTHATITINLWDYICKDEEGNIVVYEPHRFEQMYVEAK